MTVYLIFGNTVTPDGELISSDANYTNARNGSNLATIGPADGVSLLGQQLQSGTYKAWEYFMEFTISGIAATEKVVSAYFDVFNIYSIGAPARDIEIRERDFGASLTTADWVPGGTLGSLSLLGTIQDVQNAPGNLRGLRAGSDTLRTRVTGTNPLRVVASSSKLRSGTAPTTSEYNGVNTPEGGGTSNDPMLVVETIRQSTMVFVGGQGHVQLSDGTEAYLEFNGDFTTPSVAVKRFDGTSVSTLATLVLSTSFSVQQYALQQLAITRDSSDNLYILGVAPNLPNRLVGKALEKTGASTWTERTTISSDLPAYVTSASSFTNNVVAVWHNTGGNGMCMVAVSRAAHTGKTGMMHYATVNCDAMLAGAGTLIAKSGTLASFMSLYSSAEYVDYPNETGTGLDICNLGSSVGGTSGAIATYDADDNVAVQGYNIASDGTITNRAGVGGRPNAAIFHDPNSKLRVIPIDSSRFVTISGGRVVVWSWSSSYFGFEDMGAIVASFPTASALNATSAWDAMYDENFNVLWIYYLDVADSRLLKKTSIDMSTYQANIDEVSVATIGASGSTDVSLRVARGFIAGRNVRVSIANITSGGVHSTQYVNDSINLPPVAPTLAAVAPFDASASKTLTWTFNDPNAGDTQSAYELQIVKVSDSSTVVSTGKVTSTQAQRVITAATLTNGETYQWRVRTWDFEDEVGPYSAYGQFDTSTAGTLTIIAPSVDNDPGNITADYTVTWSVTGATQAAYKVRVIRTSDSAVHSDTGWVASVATSKVITGLSSGVEYRVEVTARSGALVETNTAQRLITPAFSNPMTPTIVLTNETAYVHVVVNNPTPTGDLPEVTTNQLYRRKSGETDWVHIANLGYNGSYNDYAVGSGIWYEYYVLGIANSSQSASAIGNIVVTSFKGVYIHDPDDPAGTITHFLYGNLTRKSDVSVSATSMKFVGRTSPVFDFGDNEEENVSATFDVPFGDEWLSGVSYLQNLVRGRDVFCYRDNRGRVIFGVAGGVGVSDQRWGSAVGMTVERADYTEMVS